MIMNENLTYDEETLARAKRIQKKNGIAFEEAIRFAQPVKEEEEEVDLYSVIEMIKSLVNQKEDRK